MNTLHRLGTTLWVQLKHRPKKL